MTARKKPPNVRPVGQDKPPLHNKAEVASEADGDATYHDTHTHLYLIDVAGKTDDEVGDLIDAIIEDKVGGAPE